MKPQDPRSPGPRRPEEDRSPGPRKPEDYREAKSPAEFDSAYEALLAMLRDYGLESLASAVMGFLQDGYTEEQIGFLLQDTPEYKERFQGNELRRQAGLAVLSPREYLSVEASYRQIMSSAGLPVGFYDQPSDFAEWIGRDVSPNEVNTRVGFALEAANRLDSNTLQAFQEWYGVGPTDLAAFFLDQDRALPHITKIAKGIRIKDQATDSGLNLSQSEAERLGGLVGDRDVDTLAAQYAEAARLGEALSNRYGGVDYRQADAAAEVFEKSDEARRRRKSLADKEEAAFAGSSGVGRTTLAKPKTY